MNLNKNTSFVLLRLLSGDNKSAQISEHLSLEPRTTQRSLLRLCEMGLLTKKGPTNNPQYEPNYDAVLGQIVPRKLLEREALQGTTTNSRLIDWLGEQSDQKLNELFALPTGTSRPSKMTAKELEHLTIKLSWKSSALEGNTYTLIDTQLLLTEGIRPAGKTDFETQMILNHKDTIRYITDNPEAFLGTIQFAALEQLHRTIGFNIGLAPGVRKRIVKITGSNYTPLAKPYQIKESADAVLNIISRLRSPQARALAALSLVPYLQIFEDGNKRTGRMLANALLISAQARGFSLRGVEAKDLALAYLSFYEFNSLKALSSILTKELSS